MNSTFVEPIVRFSLNPENGVPIYRQIIRQIEYAILSERLCPGNQLPTIRALAVDLKINPNTIARAYGELEIRGILVTQVGSGTYVSDKRPEAEDDGHARKIRELLDHFVREMQGLGVDLPALTAMIRDYPEGV
jgi:GntR family transcriptional regulator